MATAPGAEQVVFENVRVLTMTDAGVLESATVVTLRDRIDRVIDAGGSGGGGVDRIIDGKGLTLMPGLADMHVHYFNEANGPLFLANSVTTAVEASYTFYEAFRTNLTNPNAL